MPDTKLTTSVFAVILFLSSNVYSQNAVKQVNNVQPKIMVMPFAKEGEDIRTVLEGDFNRRVAITKVKEGFDNRNFTTIDFTAKLKQALDDRLFTSDKQSDMKATLVELSGADIYVEVEVPEMIKGTTERSGNSARLILNAYDASTANSYANKVCESPKFYTDDYGALVGRALSKSENIKDAGNSTCLEDFLNTLQSKFLDILENGRPVKINFALSQESAITFSDEIKPDGLPFSDVIENWMAENAEKNYFHLQGTTDLRLYFDEVRIPLKDPRGRNYTLSNFGLKIYTFLKTKKINCSRETRNGTLYITIN